MADDPGQRRYLSPAEVAARWNCSTRFVQKLVKDGSLAAVVFGPKLTRIPAAALEAFEASKMTDRDVDDEKPQPLRTPTMKNPAKVAFLRRRLSK